MLVRIHVGDMERPEKATWKDEVRRWQGGDGKGKVLWEDEIKGDKEGIEVKNMTKGQGCSAPSPNMGGKVGTSD